jgi:hypothetical protein
MTMAGKRQTTQLPITITKISYISAHLAGAIDEAFPFIPFESSQQLILCDRVSSYYHVTL